MAKARIISRAVLARKAGRWKRRRIARGRIPRSLRQPVQYFKRTQYIPNAISVAPNPVPGFRFGTYTFNMNGVPSVTDFTTLYDQYRIGFIKFQIIPKWNSVEMDPGTGNINNATNIMTVLDYDDSTTPASIDVMTQYQNLKMTRGGSAHKRAFVPRQLVNVYRGPLVGDGHEVVKPKWNDMAYLDVTHYGLKWAIQENPNLGQQFDVKIDYYLAMKNVH